MEICNINFPNWAPPSNQKEEHSEKHKYKNVESLAEHCVFVKDLIACIKNLIKETGSSWLFKDCLGF